MTDARRSGGPGGGSALAVALGGMIALAVAMGLGRFLYTPLLPMMLEGSPLEPAGAGALASLNFAGYLLGALAASLPGAMLGRRGVIVAALAASAATTGAMGLTDSFAVWGLLRFAGGFASAFVLVLGSALVAGRLASLGRPGLFDLHFAGVGVGIMVSAAVAAPAPAAALGWSGLWLAGGILGLAGVAAASMLIPPAPAPVEQPAAASGGREPGLGRLAAAYFCVGFGYVITATFIVAILREGGSGPAGESLVWALVGLTAAPSVLAWSLIARRIGVVGAYFAGMLVQAAGVALSALADGILALGLAAAALGFTFVALTALGLREAARRAGGDGRAAMALMTASFSVGQIIGPALAGWLREALGGYEVPSLMAAAVLVAGAAIAAPLVRRP